jgi:MFS family permease
MSTASAPAPEQLPPHYRRNFAAGLIHGVFFQASAALSSIHTVFPSLVAALTPAASAVGLMATLQSIGQVIPQLYTAYIVDGMKRRKPLLLGIITFRFLSFGLLAWLVYEYGLTHPTLVLVALLTLFGAFSFLGGMGSVVYADIFARAIPARRRGRFSGSKQLIGYALAVLAGYFVKWVLGNPHRFPFPTNFAIILGASAVTLAVALTGFALIKEPPVPERRVLPERNAIWGTAVMLFKSSRSLQWLLVVQSMIMLTLAVAPFFVVHAKQDLGIPLGAVGIYLSLQMGGAAVSNILWAWLSDHHGNRSVIVGVALTAMLATLLAWLTPASLGWLYGGVFILLGSTISGTSVGFANIILEMADEPTRPVCVALRNTALLPIAFAPLLVGFLSTWLSYPLMFAIASGISLLAFILGVWKLPEPRHNPDAVCSL